MRYLILTDIHANLEGLQACLQDAKRRGYDQMLVLGDIVGYGPDPNAVIDIIRELKPAAIVRGNHDKVAFGLNQAEGFHAAARAAAHWMLESLTEQNREWLVALPMGPKLINGADLEICHGAPFDEDAYIFDELDARHAFDAATAPVCFYGHTHFAVVFRLVRDLLDIVGPPDGDTALMIDPTAKYLVNPGSVGQPRDGDPRAAYAIYDTATRRVDLLRLPYPLEVTQQKMMKVGLPEPLARRLALGR